MVTADYDTATTNRQVRADRHGWWMELGSAFVSRCSSQSSHVSVEIPTGRVACQRKASCTRMSVAFLSHLAGPILQALGTCYNYYYYYFYYY